MGTRRDSLGKDFQGRGPRGTLTACEIELVQRIQKGQFKAGKLAAAARRELVAG